MRIIDRLDKYIALKGLNDNQITKNAHLSVGLLGKARQGKSDIGKKAIDKILSFYQDLSYSWLLTGEGEMLKSASNEMQSNLANSQTKDYISGENPETHTISIGKVIPLYDAEAAAGADYGMNMEPARPIGMIEIGGLLKDSESALRVYGNSMVPNYPAGCVIGLHRHLDSFIEPGKVYVLETADNRYLKRLYYNKDKSAFRCVSDNTMIHTDGPMAGEYYYQDFEIPFDAVKKLFRVIGVVKRNTL